MVRKLFITVLKIIGGTFGVLLIFVAVLVFAAAITAKEPGLFCVAVIFILLGVLAIAFGTKRKPYANPYTDATFYDNLINGEISWQNFVLPAVNYNGLFLQPDEILLYAVPASVFSKTEEIVGYKGVNSGLGFDIAKGVTYNTGRSELRAVRGNVTKFINGDYIITNMRIIFISQKGSFEIKSKMITAIKVLSFNSFIIASGNISYNITLDKSQLKYAVILSNISLKMAEDRTNCGAKLHANDGASLHTLGNSELINNRQN